MNTFSKYFFYEMQLRNADSMMKPSVETVSTSGREIGRDFGRGVQPFLKLQNATVMIKI